MPSTAFFGLWIRPKVMKYIELLQVAWSVLTKQILGYVGLKNGRDTVVFETSPSSVFLHTDNFTIHCLGHLKLSRRPLSSLLETDIQSCEHMNMHTGTHKCIAALMWKFYLNFKCLK